LHVSFTTALPDINGEIYKPKVAVATNETFRQAKYDSLSRCRTAP